MERELAQHIWQARRDGLIIDPPSRTQSGLDLDTAYRVQALVTEHRLAAGERIVGWKLGYTSQVMREQMGIDRPNFGPLTNVMSVASGGLAPSFLRQPRVEPEVALVIDRDIAHPLDVTELAEHVREARASLEVVDSSWRHYQFDLGDNTADSSSAGAFVLGDQLPVDQIGQAQVTLTVSTEEPQHGTSDAAMGHPLAALEWLINQLTHRGTTLPAGAVVLTGGLTRAVPLAPGARAQADFRLGSAEYSVAVHRAGESH